MGQRITCLSSRNYDHKQSMNFLEEVRRLHFKERDINLFNPMNYFWKPKPLIFRESN